MMRTLSQALVITSLILATLFPASGQENRAAKRTPFTPIQDVESLPRVLLLGDSISIGYTIDVQDFLKGKANVHRAAENCGPTTRGLEKLDAWLGDKKWDVIHFNFGLHDLKYINDEGQLVDVQKGKRQVALDDYETNLRQIVRRLQQTSATLIWRNTTPVPPGAKGRVPGDELTYNEVALRVMKKAGVSEVDDLHAFAAGRLDRIQQPANVHFHRAGSKLLGLQVAKKLKSSCRKRRQRH